eukprot:scaffold751_cov155-Isochrysis_galbana.AAC.1
MDPAKLAAYGDQDTEAIKKTKMIQERLSDLAPVAPSHAALTALSTQSIKDTFDVFDKEASGTVDVRELGALVRNLGVFPQVSTHGTMQHCGTGSGHWASLLLKRLACSP